MSAARPTVFCLHGIGGGAATFDALAAAAPDLDIRGLDLPGFGAEPAAPPLSFERLRAWLLRRLDADGAPRAHLFGHSIGGMIALDAAAAAPERVASLALCCATPAFGGRDESFKEAFLAARLGPLDAGLGMAALAERSAAEMVGPNAPPEAAEAVAAVMRRVDEAVFRDIVRCLTTFDRRAALPEIATPTLAIAGADDAAAPARTVAKMAATLPNAAYVEIPGGHMLPQEAPEAVAEALRAHILGVGGDS